MTTLALTGHTRGLGAVINQYLAHKGHVVLGFSLTNGHDLRDHSQVGRMIDRVQGSDWFVNCAKPDYAQSQILYRLMASGFDGRVLNIGSPVVHRATGWSDLGLLEYSTQKVALHHAHQMLAPLYPSQLIMWEPDHTLDYQYVSGYLERLGL